MKLDMVPQGVLEQILLRIVDVPLPLLHTAIASLLARTVMTGTKLGVFEALEAGPLSGADLARECRTHEGATKSLADALVCTGYLTLDGGRYGMTAMARRWMPRSRRDSMHDSILFSIDEHDYMSSMENYVRTGEALDIHDAGMNDERWSSYQRGMRSRQSGYAPEAAKRTPVAKGARRMLDIGGSHGLFSVEICKLHPGLNSVILDLPEAVKHAAPILAEDLAREGMEGRVVHEEGNALSDDLGTDAYDLVFMSQLAHHFDDSTNRDLAKKVAKALRPGGAYVIQESIRTETPSTRNQIGGMLDLYFAMLSESGTWAFEEMASWQREAGLTPWGPVRYRSTPGMGQQAGVKS